MIQVDFYFLNLVSPPTSTNQVMTGLLPQESRAEEPFNPLKLKGYFWETGKFYEGQTSGISESNITKILEELGQTESLLQLANTAGVWF